MSDQLLPFLAVPPLLCLSAFFSGSETALFSLRPEDRAALRARIPGSRAARAALTLLETPRALLVAILFGNLVVNSLIVAVTAHALAPWGADAVLTGSAAITAAVIVLGEVLPKAVGVTRPVAVALLAARPLLVFRNTIQLLGIVGPLERPVLWLIDRVERRLPPAQTALTDRELRRFVELQGPEGLEQQMAELLADVLELRRRRAHEIMTPRVDLVAFDLRGTRQEFLDLVRRHRHGKVPVHRGGGIDAIDGWLAVREVLARPELPLGQLVKKLWLVPHTKSLESLLREMTERHEPVALVVGEYGGTRGLVTLEDVVEEITGDIAREQGTPLLESLADGTWRLAGRFPLREVAELLGIEAPPGPTTLSGFVAHLLGRLPAQGDLAWHEGIQFRVDAVERRRATVVRVALPGPDRVHGPAPADVGPTMSQSAAHRAHARLQRFAESNPAHDLPDEGSAP